MKTIRFQLLVAFVATHDFRHSGATAAGILLSGSDSQVQSTNRTILPILEPERPAYTELDVRNTQPPPRFEVTAPSGAPNVVIVLIDDLGFGATTTFGGPIPDADV